jgi:hypothetical protein
MAGCPRALKSADFSPSLGSTDVLVENGRLTHWLASDLSVAKLASFQKRVAPE